VRYYSKIIEITNILGHEVNKLGSTWWESMGNVAGKEWKDVATVTIT